MDPHQPAPRQTARALEIEPASRTAIVAVLGEEIAGFEVTGRDVDLADGRRPKSAHAVRADWVGTDRSGRRVLVGLSEGTDDEAILWAVEAVASARRMHSSAATVAVRGRRSIAASAQVPLVVLIVRSCSARLLETLAFLPEDGIVLLEAHQRRGSGRSKPLLVRRDPRSEKREPESSGNRIAAWPPAARELAESLSVRVRRIDPSIERTDSEHGLSFLFRDEETAMLSFFGGKLVGAGGSGGDLAPIEDEHGAEVWLERVLRTHCARLQSGVRPTRPADLLARSGPLLSLEELAAFRDD